MNYIGNNSGVPEINKIYNGSCLDTMKHMPDKFVDLVVTSPPYNMGGGEKKERRSAKYKHFNDNMSTSNFYQLHHDILGELIRVSHIVFYNFQIVVGSKSAFPKIVGDFSDNVKDIIIWDKCKAPPAFVYSMLNKQTELVVVFEDIEKAASRVFTKYNFRRAKLNDLWKVCTEKKIIDTHSAVFPDTLAERIIYDPFMGSGTTAKMAIANKRNFIGSEIAKEYTEFIAKKLKLYKGGIRGFVE